MKKVSLWLFLPIGLLVKIISYIKGQRFQNKIKIEGPAITLSNHTSFYDFLYTFNAIYPRRMNFLAAMKMFYMPFLKQALKLSKAIPKALLQPDASATIKTLKVLKCQGVVAIFPEGQISMTGVFMPPNTAVAKLIKKAKVDVYFIKHQNAYMVNPPWTKKSFKGIFYTSMTKYSKEEIELDSIETIYQKVIDALNYDPYQYNQIKRLTYKLKPIQGLEHMIYTCPSCHETALKADSYQLVCQSCDNQLKYDKYGQLNEKGLSYYIEQQREYLKDQLRNNPDFMLEHPCKLEMIVSNKITFVGSGVITLGERGYQFKGSINNEAASLYFDPKDVPSMPSDIGQNIQIYHDYELYQFVFIEPHLPTMYVLFGELLHRGKLDNHITSS